MKPLVDIAMFRAIHRKAMLRQITYCWGGDGSTVDTQIADIRCLDCSLYSHILMGKASGGNVMLPRTSAEQHQWCRDKGLARLPYNRDTFTRNYGKLLICFIVPEDGVHAGHVWYVNAGQTLECYGSGGVGTREWYTPILATEADSAYLLEVPNGD